MNKKIKKILLLFLITIFIIIILIANKHLKHKEKSINKSNATYFLQVSSDSKFRTSNKFIFTDSNGNKIKENNFIDKGDVSYTTYKDNDIYSFGPGGLYKTNIKTMDTTKLSKENVDIVKFYNNKLYYFVNLGFDKDKYASKICTKSKCQKFTFFICDFEIYGDYYYISSLDDFYIYQGDKLISKINKKALGFYSKILRINDRFFLLNKDNFYEIKNNELIKSGHNGLIKDLNFKTYTLDNKTFIYDRPLNKMFEVNLDKEVSIKENPISKKAKGYNTYSFKKNDIIFFTMDYKKNEIKVKDKDGKYLAIIMGTLNKDESVFNVYEIK